MKLVIGHFEVIPNAFFLSFLNTCQQKKAQIEQKKSLFHLKAMERRKIYKILQFSQRNELFNINFQWATEP